MIILHYVPSIDVTSGGVGVYIQLLARELGKYCELHVVTHKRSNELQLENCIVHYIPYKWKPWNNCKIDFLKLLTDIKPDVFHSNCCWMPISALTAIWAKSLGYRVVYSPHGMLEPYSIKRFYWKKKLPAIILFQKKGIAISDIVHATAETEKYNLLKLGWNNNVHVVPNCVHVDQITLKTTWKRTKKILFLSRIHPKKGIELLIEAVRQIKNEIQDYNFIIAGLGEESYINYLSDLVTKNGLSDYFQFIGPVFGESKWLLYRSADLFILPTYSENFGIVVAEALASGTPVLTTYGAPWSELNELKCGWCTNIGSESIAMALKCFLLCSEGDLKQMGLNGRRLVERKYSSTAVAKQFIDLYKF